MGTILCFYVPTEDVLQYPEEYNWDVDHCTKLCMVSKRYALQTMIFDCESCKDSSFLVGQEMGKFEIPAGDLARCLALFWEQADPLPEEGALTAYIAALPPDRLVIISRE